MAEVFEGCREGAGGGTPVKIERRRLVEAHTFPPQRVKCRITTNSHIGSVPTDPRNNMERREPHRCTLSLPGAAVDRGRNDCPYRARDPFRDYVFIHFC